MTASDVVANRTLQVTRTMSASPDEVFRAWTEPEPLKQWCAPEGYAVLGVDLDLRVGGEYWIAMKHPDEAVVTVVGKFLAIEPGRRLVYTTAREGTEMEAGHTRVSAELHARDGGTEVHVTHSGFDSDEVYDFHEWAWNSCLDLLAQLQV
jgi:glutathione S-transferase